MMHLPVRKRGGLLFFVRYGCSERNRFILRRKNLTGFDFCRYANFLHFAHHIMLHEFPRSAATQGSNVLDHSCAA